MCDWQAELCDAMAHLIVEAGIIPGDDDMCRCEQCKMVAISMADAGYLDNIEDKWWEK